MNFSMVLMGALLLVLSAPASAQWLKYPTRGVPRTANGQANLWAAPPRTADGKPDLSGLWEPKTNRPCPPDGCDDGEITYEFINIGWNLKGGLPYTLWAAEQVQRARQNMSKDDPTTRCLPTGIVKGHTDPVFRKFIQLPNLLVILSERNANFRQIFLDGRPLEKDPNPSWNGYSTGHWEGDTLVVESNGFRDGIWLDVSGSPLTEGAKITERFRRPMYGQMEVDLTIEDPKAYTRPWTVKLEFIIGLDTEMVDYICLENEKDLKHMVGK